MEFPEVGKNCSWPACKQLDFLPVTCTHCGLVFCKDHVGVDRHECSGASETDPATRDKAPAKSFACSSEDCKDSSAVEMPCPKCGKHFCLLHRYHVCFEMPREDAEAKKLRNASKQQFAETLNNINKAVNEGIKKSMQNPKKQEAAHRLNLMRLKAKSKGPTGVPVESRLYFLVIPSKDAKSQGMRAIYTSQDWSVGRVIDSVSDMCGVPNQNNVTNARKLRLFKKVNGHQISPDTSIKLKDLISERTITNGETLILEYVAPSEDLANFTLSNYEDYEDT